MTPTIRPLESYDARPLAEAFAAIGWRKPETQFQHYLEEADAGHRLAFVAQLGDDHAGYGTLRWTSFYAGFARAEIPEIADLNVLPDFRRRGVATKLLDQLEEQAFERSSRCGIGVGLHPGYGPAQRLYVKRGYVPDGTGAHYHDRPVQEGEELPLDDSLVLYLIKSAREDYWV
ncbi:MAG: GNAT family N-acetyltransferase [Spirochaetota bacterium]